MRGLAACSLGVTMVAAMAIGSAASYRALAQDAPARTAMARSAQEVQPRGTSSANPLDVIPPKMPFSTPYGPPISLQRAQALLQAAIAEADRRGWQLNVAVVDSGGNLVAFARMDGAMLASITIAEHKARAAAEYRRPTRVFEDAVQRQGSVYVLTLHGVIASRGGIPLIEHGKLIGAIGCSGGAGSQDEAVCAVAAATINGRP
jgi:glc operon protein GlcG